MESRSLKDPEALSAFVARPKMTIPEKLLGVVGIAIAILILSAVGSFGDGKYQNAALKLAIAALVAFVFFHRRKAALVVCVAATIAALCLQGLVFHPSLVVFLSLLGCFAAIWLTARWCGQTYPFLSYKHVHAFWKGEEAMAAENARLEVESREWNSQHPRGPWIFR
jgi:hypothetical protein